MELSRKELIELVASTFLRVTGFTYLFSAFSNLWHLEADVAYIRDTRKIPDAYDLHLHQLLIMDIIYNLAIAGLMMLLPVALARLTCRGLDAALESKRQA
jgi:hypothetical protein